MMAPDSSSSRPNLSAAAIAGLDDALRAFLSDPSDATRLEPALRTVATEAREKNVHAEQLLVLLKDMWFALPQVRSATSGEAQNALLQRVVTQCIREYYSH